MKAIGNEINVHLTNSISGQALANQKITVYQKQADGTLKWHLNKNTDAQGKVILDLKGLGDGTQYQFRTTPNGTGHAYSNLINTAGFFNFKVGKLEARIISGETSKPLATHKVSIRELLADGKSKWTAGGLTDSNGIIRFDIPNLGNGKKYILAAINPFENKYKFSEVITQNGKVTFTVGNQLLNVHLINAISGQALANQEITVYQKQADSSLKWHLKKNTDAQGKIILDLPGLGAGTQYQFRTTPYATGHVYSDLINTTGSFDFKVGKLEAKIIRGETGQPLITHKVSIREQLPDGKSKWTSGGLTDTNGVIRFDIPNLGSGKKYILAAINPFDNKHKFSGVITQNGKVTFTVGNQLLNVHLINAISGQALANQEITVYQKQADGSLKWYLKKNTDAKGKIILDLPGLGIGTQYQFRATPYGTGHVYSNLVNTAGSFEFKVGRLEAKVIKGQTSKPLAAYKVSIREILGDGSSKLTAGGITDANGIIRFDIPNLGNGKKYVFAAINSFNNKTTYSNAIGQNGKITFTIGNQLLTVNLINAISRQTLNNQEITVYQKQADGSLKWYLKKNTDAEGKIVLDLPELGTGIKYQFKTKPYGTGSIYSDLVNTTGSFDFKVGRLEAKIIRGETGQPLTTHKVSIRELQNNGTTEWIAGGLTDSNGIIRFDIPNLGSGKKYALAAVNPFDGKTDYSDAITQNGKVTFTVGNQLLNVKLTNAISGQALANQEIKVFQQLAGGSLKFSRKNFTNNQGQVSFDLDKLGKGGSYILVSKAYGTTVKSNSISQVGVFNFKIGKVQVRLSDKNNNQNLINKQLVLLKKTSDGKLHWEAAFNSDQQGLVHFDPINLGTGAIYVVRAKNLFGNNKTFYSPWIISTGAVNFSVSPNDNYSADLNPPEITFISPFENALVSDAGFEVKTKITDGEELNSVNYKVIDPIKGESSGTMQLIRGQWKFLATSTMLTTSKYVNVVITAIDVALNKTEVSRQFQVIKDIEDPIINILSHQNHNQVSENGFLLAGSVIDNTGVKEITASVMDPLLGLVIDNKSLEVSTGSGRWALSIREVSRNNVIKVTLISKDYAGNETIKQLTLNVMTNGLNGRQLIDRITFGATDELLEKLKTPSGTETFLYEQLHPELVDDSEFESMLAELGEPDSPATLQNYQLAHAIYSKRHLQEVMTWFWENHFSTDMSKGGSTLQLAENKKFRKHALGNFRDLLQISATSPAMLIYLDNRFNHKNEPNENYARELLELHTLGVNGGYTQNDVAETARVFTGWKVKDQSFYFQNWHHDNGEKYILGNVIPSGLGIEEGEILLDLLSTHPSTANFICTKLLQVFVSDTPDNSSINGCSTDFLKYTDKNDQIARVLEGIFRSKSFAASQHFHSKVKNPLEFVAGFVRQFPISLAYYNTNNWLRSMNMNLFFYPLPTGLPEVGEKWVNSNQYLQYFQFIHNSVFNKPSEWENYLNDPSLLFTSKGYETAEGVAGYLFYLALSNDYSDLEWNTAINILTENGKIDFDINDAGATERIKKLLTTVLNFPIYQLQ